MVPLGLGGRYRDWPILCDSACRVGVAVFRYGAAPGLVCVCVCRHIEPLEKKFDSINALGNVVYFPLTNGTGPCYYDLPVGIKT